MCETLKTLVFNAESLYQVFEMHFASGKNNILQRPVHAARVARVYALHGSSTMTLDHTLSERSHCPSHVMRNDSGESNM